MSDEESVKEMNVKFSNAMDRLRKSYRDASELQKKTEANSTGWWWCQGRMDAAEISLLIAGYEP